MKTIALFFIAALSYVQLHAETADEILAKHLSAIGGVEKLKAINTKKILVTMENRGMQFSITMLHSRPNKMRTEVDIMGKKQLTAFDGKSGWTINPFTGRETVEQMSPDDIREMTLQADFDGPLIDYKSKGHKLSMEADEDIDGSACYHLKLSTADNQVMNYYVDKDSYLLVLEKSKVKNEDGSEAENEMAFSNYKAVNGILMPYNIEQRASYQGQKFNTPMKVTEYQLNVDIPEALYAVPADKK